MQSGVSDFQIAPNNIQEKYSLQSFYSWQTKVVKPPPKMLSTFPAPPSKHEKIPQLSHYQAKIFYHSPPFSLFLQFLSPPPCWMVRCLPCLHVTASDKIYY